MKSTMRFLVLYLVVAVALPANAFSLSDYGPDRFWKYNVDNDEFNGRLERVLGLGMNEGGTPVALIRVSRDESAAMFMITNTADYICPDPSRSDIQVQIWFSDGGPVLDQVWKVHAGGTTTSSYGYDGNDILERLSSSEKTIFRIHDGCGDVVDYWTKGTNIRSEWAQVRE